MEVFFLFLSNLQSLHNIFKKKTCSKTPYQAQHFSLYLPQNNFKLNLLHLNKDFYIGFTTRMLSFLPEFHREDIVRDDNLTSFSTVRLPDSPDDQMTVNLYGKCLFHRFTGIQSMENIIVGFTKKHLCFCSSIMASFWDGGCLVLPNITFRREKLIRIERKVSRFRTKE